MWKSEGVNCLGQQQILLPARPCSMTPVWTSCKSSISGLNCTFADLGRKDPSFAASPHGRLKSADMELTR